MTTFVFRLESVLRWRQAQLELEQCLLARLAAEGGRWDLILAKFESSRAEAEALILSSSSVHGEELEALDRYRKHLGQERLAALDRRREAAEKIEQQRRRVLAARREFRLLERLRHARRKDWELAVNREFEALAAETYLAHWTPHQASKRKPTAAAR